jgi:hypothetical protein
MPYSGDTFTLPSNTWNPAVAGVSINPGDWNTIAADLQGGLSAVAERVTEAVAAIAAEGVKHCTATMSANQVFAPGNNAWNKLYWTAEALDTSGFHDSVTNSSRLTIPSGITTVRFNANLYLTGSPISGTPDIKARLTKNGGSITWLPIIGGRASTVNDIWLQLVSGILPVTAGDYYEVELYVPSTANMTVQTNGSFFSIEGH